MPAERTRMRQVREVLRLKLVGGVSTREIARRIGVTPSTVRNTLKRFQASGLGWPLPAEMTDGELESKLFAVVGTKQGHRRHLEPDWASVHRELSRKHVTLAMLLEEHIEANPASMSSKQKGRRHRRDLAQAEITRLWCAVDGGPRNARTAGQSGMAPSRHQKTAPLVVVPVRSRRSQWSSAEDHSSARTSRTYRI